MHQKLTPTNTGYEIGDDIAIHKDSRQPDEWLITIKSIGIESKHLCYSTATPEVIKNRAIELLEKMQSLTDKYLSNAKSG